MTYRTGDLIVIKSHGTPVGNNPYLIAWIGDNNQSITLISSTGGPWSSPVQVESTNSITDAEMREMIDAEYEWEVFYRRP